MPKRKLITTMQPDELEQRLQRLPRRELPAEWRAEILSAAGAPASSTARSGLASAVETRRAGGRRSVPAWWLAWLNPSRAGWTVLGAAWLVIIVLNFVGSDASPTTHGPSIAASPQQWRERQRLMAELIGPAEPVKPPAVTRPRSERTPRPLLHHA